MIGLNKTASVYTADPTTGAYTVLAKSGLRCRLAIKPSPAETADERAELNHRRRLLWDEAYTMPETAQVEIEAVRWNVQAGTVDVLTDLGSTVIYRRADVVKVL